MTSTTRTVPSPVTLRERLAPDHADLVDAGFGTVLAVLGIVGFRTTFAGNEELIVGIPACLLGALTGYVLVKLRVPLLTSAALAAVVFFILGGPIALRHRALGGVLPSPDAISGLADALINSWMSLLTTLPPAGSGGDLLAIPYLCGFVGAALAVGLARRFTTMSWCALPPALVLTVSVLMGVKEPASLLLQGAAFAALTIAWVSVRHHRNRDINQAGMARSRVLMAAGLLLVSALGGVVVGPRLPGASEIDRYVLREDVEPPFDPLKEPSPLAAYRNYTDQDVREDEVLTAAGLPAGGRLRIAVMDDYDGLVWRATGSGSVVAGEYLRVGEEIPSDGHGTEREISIEVHKPHGVWVPLGGDVTNISFTGDRADVLNDEVRVSIQTDSAAVPRELQPGDSYTFRAEFVNLPDEDILVETAMDGRFQRIEGEEVPAEFVSRAAEWAENQPTEYAELLAIARALKTEGAYTDGGLEANPTSPPGHSLRRLLDFIDTEQPFGNGEQFGAGQGLLAKARGIPVRVVMGFINEKGDDGVTFRGQDIEAWIEVPVDGYGWVPVDGTPPEDQLPDPIRQPRSKTENPEPQPPPPTTIPPPTSIPDELEPEEPEEEDEEDDAGSGIPGWALVAASGVGVPLVVFGGPALLIVGLKGRRRARRRNKGTPSQRVSGSFSELVDYARDTGAAMPPKATRHEKSMLVAAGGAGTLATRADTATFGPAEPTDTEIEEAWAEFAESRTDMMARMDRRARLRAALSLTSLRRHS